jgi:predicted GNAT family acetyltransferase
MNNKSALAASDEVTNRIERSPGAVASLLAQPIKNEDKDEVFAFLAVRPLHTVYISGLIRDNGLESPLNRGKFYCCRNEEGQLEGVALIGHATLIEARTEAALQTFAAMAQTCKRAHMIMGESEKIQTFWNFYADGGQSPRLACRELLFEQRWPVEVRKEVRGLRRATLRDLEMVLPVQAEMAYEESGVNPMEKDPNGFRLRCARRIEQGRVWVLIENGRLIFKADIMSDTAEVVYLEGIYVAPEERGNGVGRRCLSQLTRNLLARTKSVSLLVNEQNQMASEFYLKAGFKMRAHYDTIFLQQASA